jgi:spermidine/putrescine transport system permease protein
MLQYLRERPRLQGFLLVLPALLWMIFLLVIPLVLTIITSFGRRDADGNVIYTFTLENYLRLIGIKPEG